MSMTYSRFISRALIDLGRLGEGQEASASQLQTGLEVLNGFMAGLKTRDLDFHWYEAKQANAGDPIPIPEEYRESLLAWYAVTLAPTVRAPVTIELAAKAKSGRELIGARLINQQLGNADMSHLPRGSGHRGSLVYDIDTDQS